jgi:cell fate regulator YaaT (PSP1 superfamily)
LCEFIPVSIKMAKVQDLPLSPMEISGVCGRLLCCLTYENAYYQEARSRMPKIGDVIPTPGGAGRVAGQNVLKETVLVELESGITTEVPVAEIGLPAQPKEDPLAPSPRHERPYTRRHEHGKRRSAEPDS